MLLVGALRRIGRRTGESATRSSHSDMTEPKPRRILPWRVLIRSPRYCGANCSPPHLSSDKPPVDLLAEAYALLSDKSIRFSKRSSSETRTQHRQSGWRA